MQRDTRLVDRGRSRRGSSSTRCPARERRWSSSVRACPTCRSKEAIRRIREGPDGGEPPHPRADSRLPTPWGRKESCSAPGANATLRRPARALRPRELVAKPLDVPSGCWRIPVHVQVVGGRRRAPGDTSGLRRNLSVHGMLLASPVRMEAEDLDLEITCPSRGPGGCSGGSCARPPEVGWPIVGYGMSSSSCRRPRQRAIDRMVRGDAARAGQEPLGPRGHPLDPAARRLELRDHRARADGQRLPGRGPPRLLAWTGAPGGEPLYVVAGRDRRGPSTTARDSCAATALALPRVWFSFRSGTRRRRSAPAWTRSPRDARRPRSRRGRRRLADGSGELLRDRARAPTRASRRCPARASGLVARAEPRARRGPRSAVAGMDADDRAGTDVSRARRRGWSGTLTVAFGCRVALAGRAPSPGEGMRAYVARQNALLDHDAMARDRFVESPARPPFRGHRGRARSLGAGGGSTAPRTTTCGCSGGSTRGCASPSSKRRSSSGAGRDLSPARTPRYAPERFLALKLQALEPGRPRRRSGGVVVWGFRTGPGGLGAPISPAHALSRVRRGRPAQKVGRRTARRSRRSRSRKQRGCAAPIGSPHSKARRARGSESAREACTTRPPARAHGPSWPVA